MQREQSAGWWRIVVIVVGVWFSRGDGTNRKLAHVRLSRLREVRIKQHRTDTLLKSDVTRRDHVVRCRGSQEC